MSVQRRDAHAGSSSRDALRGLDFAEQVQRLAPGQDGPQTQQVHEAAREGVSGGGGAIPHLEAIQRSFGAHDVSSARGHVGGEATAACQAMGAEAYASGDRVAFANTPTLHTAAHEAAHIVQQRQGVSLEGGVGKAGDDYERQADQVADAVVAGRSAESLLGGRGAGGSTAASAPVQGKFTLDKGQAKKVTKRGKGTRFHAMEKGDNNYLEDPSDKSKPKLVAPRSTPPLNVSDDGKIAVEATRDTPKVMFCEAGDIDGYNAALEQAGSAFRLVNQGTTLKVPDLSNTMHTLVSVMPKNIQNDSSGLEMTGPQQCIEMAESVISEQKGDAYRTYLLNVAEGKVPMVNREGISKTMVATIGQYAMSRRRGEKRSEREDHAKMGGDTANMTPNVQRGQVDATIIELTVKNHTDPNQVGGLRQAFETYNSQQAEVAFEASAMDNDTGKMSVTIYAQNLQRERDYMRIFKRAPFDQYIKSGFWKGSKKVTKVMKGKISEPDRTYKPKLLAAVEDKENNLVETIQGLSSEELDKAVKDLGLNEYAKLGIGHAFGVTGASKSNAPKMQFPYHWAGVIAKTGDDVVTLENYARGEGATVSDDGRWYLQLYGPQKAVLVSEEGAVSEDKSVGKDFWKQGTFHGVWKGDFSGQDTVPMTVGVGTKAKKKEEED